MAIRSITQSLNSVCLGERKSGAFIMDKTHALDKNCLSSAAGIFRLCPLFMLHSWHVLRKVLSFSFGAD